MARRKTLEEFVADARVVHGNKYNYDLVRYTNSRSNVYIVCREHGEFSQKANSHINGRGCPDCAGKKLKTTEEFILNANLIHGSKYGYNLVDYSTSNKVKVIIVCPIHGNFPQTPNNHLAGQGCPMCAEDGFNPTKPSVMYVYTFGCYAGFGITNNFRKRHKTHIKSFATYGEIPKLLATYNMSGKLAQLLERHIKKTMDITNTGIDGFKTEAVHLDNLPQLLSIIDQHICA